jgi:zeaxanthin glucosyltransferase
VARFLIVVFPLLSHLYAPVAIGQAMSAAGHEVAWCGPESDLRPLVGADATVYPTGKRYYRDYPERGGEGARKLWNNVLIPTTRFALEPADRAVADYRPDVVLVDQYAFAGALAACRHGVRWASLCTGAMELTPPSWELPGHQEFVAERLAQVWQLAGLPARSDLDLRFSPHLVLALTTTALIGPAPLPPRCKLIGPILGERPDDTDFAWQDWDDARRHVLVTVGTLSDHMAHEFYPRVAAALESLDEQVQPVFAAPATVVPRRSDRLLIAGRVPILKLLPRLDAVVCHGGMGTVTETLAHGVPLVVAPIRHDQPALARQVSEAGAGITVGFSSATVADFAAAVTAVLDQPGYRTAARRVADSFAAAGGAPAAMVELTALAARP